VTARLRIGYVTGALDAAGSERQMLALAELLPADRFAPEFVVLSRPGTNAGRAATGGFPVHVVPPPINRSSVGLATAATRTVRKAVNFVTLLRRRRFDIVDAWLFHAYVLAALAKPFARPPILVTGRRSLRPREAAGRGGHLLQSISAVMSDAIVANSPQVRDEVARSEGRAERKVRVIRNGVAIPPPVDAATRAARRAELGLAPEAVVIGCVANLLPDKGHDVVIEAAARVAGEGSAVQFVLVGDGFRRPVLERLASTLRVADRVHFVGSVPEATRLLPAFDMLVHASLAEGLPNAVLEAAAAGLAIIATPAGGTVEIVRDGETGLVVPSGDAAAVAAGIARLAESPELRRRLGAAARARASSTFGMDRFAREFADLYLELAARRGLDP
jgi:glycosyltransferase involved in cell wall biosynthesis